MKNNAMNEGFDKEGSTIDLRWWKINMIDARSDFTQVNSILLLSRITKKLFKCTNI